MIDVQLSLKLSVRSAVILLKLFKYEDLNNRYKQLILRLWIYPVSKLLTSR